MKIAAQCYTVRDLMATDPIGTLQAIRGMGLNFVEITGTYGMEPSAMKEELDRLGLTVSSNHSGIDALQNDIDGVIAENEALGCSCVILAWAPRECYADGWDRFAKDLESIGKRLHEEGLTFAYHNHDFEFRVEEGVRGWDVLFEHADPRYVSGQIDTYWVAYAGSDPAAAIRQYQGRIVQVHLKDGLLGGGPDLREVGHGDLNWDEILAACEEGGVEFGAIELDTSPGDPLDAIRVSTEFLRGRGFSG